MLSRHILPAEMGKFICRRECKCCHSPARIEHLRLPGGAAGAMEPVRHHRLGDRHGDRVTMYVTMYVYYCRTYVTMYGFSRRKHVEIRRVIQHAHLIPRLVQLAFSE